MVVVDGDGDWGWKMVVVEVAVRIGGVAWGSMGVGRLGGEVDEEKNRKKMWSKSRN